MGLKQRRGISGILPMRANLNASRCSHPGLTGREPRFCNPALAHFVDGDQCYRARSLRKRARYLLMIDDSAINDRPVNQAGVQVGFLEADKEAFTNGRAPAGEQVQRWKLELLSVLRVGCHQSLNVAGVVGVELTLDQST